MCRVPFLLSLAICLLLAALSHAAPTTQRGDNSRKVTTNDVNTDIFIDLNSPQDMTEPESSSVDTSRRVQLKQQQLCKLLRWQYCAAGCESRDKQWRTWQTMCRTAKKLAQLLPGRCDVTCEWTTTTETTSDVTTTPQPTTSAPTTPERTTPETTTTQPTTTESTTTQPTTPEPTTTTETTVTTGESTTTKVLDTTSGNSSRAATTTAGGFTCEAQGPSYVCRVSSLCLDGEILLTGLNLACPPGKGCCKPFLVG